MQCIGRRLAQLAARTFSPTKLVREKVIKGLVLPCEIEKANNLLKSVNVLHHPPRGTELFSELVLPDTLPFSIPLVRSKL